MLCQGFVVGKQIAGWSRRRRVKFFLAKEELARTVILRCLIAPEQDMALLSASWDMFPHWCQTANGKLQLPITTLICRRHPCRLYTLRLYGAVKRSCLCGCLLFVADLVHTLLVTDPVEYARALEATDEWPRTHLAVCQGAHMTTVANQQDAQGAGVVRDAATPREQPASVASSSSSVQPGRLQAEVQPLANKHFSLIMPAADFKELKW